MLSLRAMGTVLYKHSALQNRVSLCRPHSRQSLSVVRAAEVEASPLPVYAADIRVGKILSCELHPEADSLYVEKIDVGEEEPRTIISGLVKFVPLEEMQDRSVVVICNLKPRNMRGIKSHGMVLCASDAAHENVEPLCPPTGAAVTKNLYVRRCWMMDDEWGAKVGERIWCEENQPAPETPNRVDKKKLWEGIQPDLKTTDDLIATYRGVPMMTSAGPIKAPTLAKANIS